MSRTKILFTTKIFVNTYFVLNKAKIEVFNTIMKGEILMSKKIYLSPSSANQITSMLMAAQMKWLQCNKIAAGGENCS